MYIYLLSRVLNFDFNLIYSFLLSVPYRKNCKKSFVQITEEGIRPKYLYIYIYIFFFLVIFSLPFCNFQIQKGKWKWNNLRCHELNCINM